MAHNVFDVPVKLRTLIYFVFFLLLFDHVGSQSCGSALPRICNCTVESFTCTAANLTDLPSDLFSNQTWVDIDVRSNPIQCSSGLLWLLGVRNVTGTCSTGQTIMAYLETLTDSVTQPVTDNVTQPVMDNVTQPVVDNVTQPVTNNVTSTPTAVGSTALPPAGTNKLYVLAIVLPIFIILIIIVTVVFFAVRKNHKEKEAYNSSIRYSVVRKEAGAGNRVYAAVTTDL